MKYTMLTMLLSTTLVAAPLEVVNIEQTTTKLCNQSVTALKISTTSQRDIVVDKKVFDQVGIKMTATNLSEKQVAQLLELGGNTLTFTTEGVDYKAPLQGTCAYVETVQKTDKKLQKSMSVNAFIEELNTFYFYFSN